MIGFLYPVSLSVVHLRIESVGAFGESFRLCVLRLSDELHDLFCGCVFRKLNTLEVFIGHDGFLSVAFVIVSRRLIALNDLAGESYA